MRSPSPILSSAPNSNAESIPRAASCLFRLAHPHSNLMRGRNSSPGLSQLSPAIIDNGNVVLLINYADTCLH